ncbi:ganglioside-induced differentiation-associated-protein 2-like [Punica granatum]|uniref:Ganglioside-induced differentiation-associated-protein 2-like n=2 Tax=Punica granatum TaxID=22663 RepID=A0A6P8E4C5_PUNGR|nr:ganglioside-induced differentiation-associated-protein 2-like [Punica granatum]PKI55170.1 hypothetical protein CRG98_024461 [Punica granatum]
MPSNPLRESQQIRLLDKLGVFEIRGRDKCGRKVLCVIGKLFPARFVSVEGLKMYLEERIYPKLEGRPFSVVYVHTGVQRTENCPGISIIRSIYEAIPIDVKQNLEVVYFVHPGIQARLFLATFGRLLFSGGLYSKLKYVNRLEFLWEHVRRREMGEMPDFVNEHDEELERCNTTIDYGLESDHPRIHFGTASMDSMVPSYSMRCIA